MTTIEPTITFLGLAQGAEIFGGTQADFAVDWPTTSAKELSVLLNDPAAAYAAEQLSRENTPEFRAEAAERLGLFIVARIIREGRLDSVTFVTREMLQRDPSLLAALQA